jgi:hypothetical protein
VDAQVKQQQRFLPALAEQLAIWFPETKGRALAVSEISITKDNVPTLPLIVTAFLRSAAEPPARSPVNIFEITDTFMIDFWLEPVRYKRANGSETPYWSYYDYEAIRDTLLDNLSRWQAPGGERVAYRKMTVEAEPFAVTIMFEFIATFRWCVPESTLDQGEQFTIGYNLCTPIECCIPDDDKELDPCQ